MIPTTISVVLAYRYLPEEIEYVFPRRRAKDAELDEQEKMVLGDGKRLSPAQRLSHLVLDIKGFPGFESRKENESDAEWKTRVFTFFKTTDNEEFAEDAVVYRNAAVFPQSLFRGNSDNSLAIDRVGATSGKLPILEVRPVCSEGEGPKE